MIELTKEDLPAHPRFKWNLGSFWFDVNCDGHINDWINHSKLDRAHLESACCIAFMHFATKMPLSIHNQAKANKWLSLLTPKHAIATQEYGKDYNGYIRKNEYTDLDEVILQKDKPCGKDWRKAWIKIDEKR